MAAAAAAVVFDDHVHIDLVGLLLFLLAAAEAPAGLLPAVVGCDTRTAHHQNNDDNQYKIECSCKSTVGCGVANSHVAALSVRVAREVFVECVLDLGQREPTEVVGHLHASLLPVDVHLAVRATLVAYRRVGFAPTGHALNATSVVTFGSRRSDVVECA